MGGDGGGEGGGKGNGRVLKVVFGALLLVVFVCLLFIGLLDNSGTKGHTAATITSLRNPGHVLSGRRSVPGNLDPIYVSKRKVPSGPDPIHNRHVGETRRSPGRV